MSGPLPVHVSASQPAIKENCTRKARDLEAIAQLVEDAIPNFRKEEDRQFYREVVRSYRAAARDVLRNARSGTQG